MNAFSEKELLLMPGPTPVPPSVLRAISQPVISHRGPAYSCLMRETTESLQRVFQTHGDVITFPASGTGALEAVIVNLFSPGDTVLAVVTGEFGQRWAEIAAAFGLNVVRLDFEWGTPASPQAVQSRISNLRSEIAGVLLTHNETSTGVTNDVQAIVDGMREYRGSNHASPVVCVDAISSLGAIDLPMDDWGLDAVVSGSQKALMLPPGLSFVALNPRAWQAHRSARLPRYYFDFTLHKQSMAKWENPYTPAINLLFGLKEALRLMESMGLQKNFERHRRLGQAVRAGVEALGLKRLVQDDGAASNTVTSVRTPDGIEASRIITALRERFNIIIAGGQGKLRGQTFRIGHVGYVHENDVLAMLSALGSVLATLDRCDDASAGVRAAQELLPTPDASCPEPEP